MEKSKDIKSDIRIFLMPDYRKYNDFLPVEFFELFFNEKLFQDITEKTNRYMLSKNPFSKNVPINEIKTFFGISIFWLFISA